ncbi:3-phosphoshikimate 1-carboxyvinyltransferase [Acaryochloris marina]|uniref:3-phosphoshikimate 1-carboxyvinyltransferase n=1 Tax=Acaryochloris marina TaxID=155978 RepID=UPI001BAF62C2|nr:3-phosphoshikimate 1-carboxyvinyltransferase [Acaryochloris marina]QUY41896.1 3-phosphoshikimate 1-carboxyvinyltransferase [Acaryochloris marina S15]
MIIEIKRSGPLLGRVRLPGDKSISHRALLFASFARGNSVIENILDANTTRHMVDVLVNLGVPIKIFTNSEGSPTAKITGCPLLEYNRPKITVDCKRSATTMRFFMGALAAVPSDVYLIGDNVLNQRPMERVALPLRLMGATVETTNGHAPVYMRGGQLNGIDYRMPVSSGQLQTALLLAALNASSNSTISYEGTIRDHSVRLLRAQGANIESIPGQIFVRPSTLNPLNVSIPGDMSSASFLIAAAILVPESDITIERVNLNPGRIGLLNAVSEMGASISIEDQYNIAGEPCGDIRVRHSKLRGIELSSDQVLTMIDEIPIFAVLSLAAHGTTTVRDAAELRVKDTDRIDSIITSLSPFSAKITPRNDGFSVVGPQKLAGCVVKSEKDHRIEMSMIVAALVANGSTQILDAGEYKESFPSFLEILNQHGATLQCRV